MAQAPSVRLRLQRRHHRDIEDIVRRAASRKIVGRLRQPLFDPGALLLPTTRSTAASACNSPSAFSSGERARTISMASTTLLTIGPRPLPLVEKLSSATTGSASISTDRKSTRLNSSHLG